MIDRPMLSARGLSSAEAERLLAERGPNQLPSARPRNLLQQAAGVLREPMLLFLVAAGGINFAIAEPLDGIVLMATVCIVIGISIAQEHRTETALVALRDLSSPRALVVRDGVRVRIPGAEVVPGDVVVLAEGDRVPADALVLDAVALSVDESALTGESVPVRKVASPPGEVDAPLGAPGGDATPFVFSGTLVVKGRGIARVRETGERSQLGAIGASLREIEPERTRLQREIDRIVRVIAVLGLGAALAVVVIYGLTRGDWLEGALAGIATAMAMLPEEFPVVLTVFLALGAWKMSRKHVLTRRSPVIETLGSATVLCVDKTGTLTQNSMVVHELVADGETHRVGEGGPLPDRFHDLAEASVLASPIDAFDPMDRAFRSLGEVHLAGSAHLAGDPDLVREYPLSEDLLAIVHVWNTEVDGPLVVAAKGAPEAVARLCGFDGARIDALTAQVERATANGHRVLAVARAEHPPDAALPDDPRAFAFRYLGLAGLQDPVRPGVPDAVAECRRAGIRVVMITGDYPGTALAIAREVGLDHDGVLTGPELAEMDDAVLAERIRDTRVFARVVPQQKLRIVRALQRNGEVVGMTGDGVNDAPALRAADIGIAVGTRGTDVAREAASLVVTDDDFTSIVAGIRLGRGIFDNLRKAMAYLIAVHVAIFGMALVPVLVADWPLVLLPIQIAFLEFIIDPTCTVVFESEEIDPEVMDRPPREPGAPLFGRSGLVVAALQGVGALAAVLGVYLWALTAGRPELEVRSLAFSTLVLTNLLLLLVNRSWRISALAALRARRNPAVKYVLAAALGILAVVLTVPPARRTFDLGPVPLPDLAIAIAAGVLGVAWFEAYKAIRRRGTRTSPAA